MSDLDPSAALSRRTVLKGAAGAGAAGLAVSALAGVALPAAAATKGAVSATRAPDGADGAGDAGETVVVHVRDASSGEIDVFRGTTAIRLHDRDLAARIVRASH